MDPNKSDSFNRTPEVALNLAWSNCENLQQHKDHGQPSKKLDFAIQYAKQLYFLAKSNRWRQISLQGETERDLEEFIEAWDRNTSSKLPDFDSRGLSSSLYAHALLGKAPSQEWLEHWKHESIKKFDQFDSQNFANSFYAFAMLGIVPDREWLLAWETSSACVFNQCTPQELTNCFYAYGKLEIAPSAKWLAAWEAASRCSF